MMIYVNSKNFFVSKDKEIYYQYFPNLSFYMDGTEMNSEDIYIDKSGFPSFNYEGEKYLIDDGYRNTLQKVGYIIYKDYDQVRCDDSLGHQILTYITNQVSDGILGLKNKIDIIQKDNNTFVIISKFYKYTVILSDSFEIVSENKDRKINGIQYYPFDKRMDKYGTLYLRLFSQKLKESGELYENDLSYIENLIKDILCILNKENNNFKFSSLELPKKKVVLV